LKFFFSKVWALAALANTNNAVAPISRCMMALPEENALRKHSQETARQEGQQAIRDGHYCL
jgi:hypothetical protein